MKTQYTLYGLQKKTLKKVKKEVATRLKACIDETMDERVDEILEQMSRGTFNKADSFHLTYTVDFSAMIILGIIGEARTKAVMKAAKRNKF
jgi:hypothetical protein